MEAGAASSYWWEKWGILRPHAGPEFTWGCEEEARLLQPASTGERGRFSIWLVCQPWTRHFTYIIILSLQSFYKVNDFISLLQMKKLRFRKLKINYINMSHIVTIPLKNNNFLRRKTTSTSGAALCARSCLNHFRLSHFFLTVILLISVIKKETEIKPSSYCF